MTLLDEKTRNRVEVLLAHRLGLAIEKREIETLGAADACDMITAAFDTIKYREDLLQFLNKLSSGWPVFGEILEAEQKTSTHISHIEHLFEKRNVKLVGSGKAAH